LKYLGNFSSYIKDEWTDEVLALPREWPRPFCEGSPEYARLLGAGYDLSSSHWAVVEPHDVSFKLDFPFMQGATKIGWWVARLFQGQFMPMHVDPHPEGAKGKFYWIPMQDYHSGHVFIINDELITNYKKGDAFIFDNFADYHGSANIGMIPKLTLLVSVYE